MQPVQVGARPDAPLLTYQPIGQGSQLVRTERHGALVLVLTGLCSCSPACQDEHWKAGHKADYNGFAHPPFARHFDTSDRADVDPVLASGASGCGSRRTARSARCTPAHSQSYYIFEALTAGSRRTRSTCARCRASSFQRWAAAKHDTVRGKEQYLGGTVRGLRVVVHNRRRDRRLRPGACSSPLTPS